jgi:hypothetical protein
MSLSMYQASVPVFARQLGTLGKVLEKGAAYAAENAIDPTELLEARLNPDMFALTRQVQIATDTVKGAMARLAGVGIPSFPDTETSFPDLQARIEKTLAFVKSFTAAQIDGTEDKSIVLKAGGKEIPFTGQTYLLHFVLPNFFFHVTTAYAILRHKNVPLGKMDYLGAI